MAKKSLRGTRGCTGKKRLHNHGRLNGRDIPDAVWERDYGMQAS
jgi:hypothetical protein